MIRALLASALLLAGTATMGETPAVAPAPLPFSAAERAVPAQLTASERIRYREIFRDLAAGRQGAAASALAAMPRGRLHATAEAQLLVAEGTGAGLTRLVDWLIANPAAPQAPQIAALARRAVASSWAR